MAAWQRGLAQKGLTAGRFYHIYSRSAATPIADPQVRARYEALREHDYGELQARIQQVRTAQAYRVVGTLERSANELERQLIPQLRAMLRGWRAGVVWRDGLLLGGGLVLLGLLAWLGLGELLLGLGGWSLGVAAVLAGYGHWQVRRRVRERIIAGLGRDRADRQVDNLVGAFQHSTRWVSEYFSDRAGSLERPDPGNRRQGPGRGRPLRPTAQRYLHQSVRDGRPPHRAVRRAVGAVRENRLARLSPTVPTCVCPDAGRVQTQPDSPRTGRPNCR